MTCLLSSESHNNRSAELVPAEGDVGIDFTVVTIFNTVKPPIVDPPRKRQCKIDLSTRETA